MPSITSKVRLVGALVAVIATVGATGCVYHPMGLPQQSVSAGRLSTPHTDSGRLSTPQAAGRL